MSDHEILSQRAAQYHDIVMSLANGPGGMIITFVDYDTRLPYQEGGEEMALADTIWPIPDEWGDLCPPPTQAEIYYGENAIGDTGMFLWAGMDRYRATGEKAALATARKCFRDINNFFRLSGMIEPGVLGKPHGGRPGATWSYDQSWCPIMPYSVFAREFATPEEKGLAIANLTAHGDMYLRRNWEINFFGHRYQIMGTGHPSGMKLLAAVYACYELTGETRFRDEVLKQMRAMIQMGTLPWHREIVPPDHNLDFYATFCDYWSRTELGDELDWKDCIRQYWEVAKTAIDEDGLTLGGNYNRNTGVFTPFPEGMLSGDEARALGLPAPAKIDTWWSSPTSYILRPCISLLLADLALLAYSRGLDDTAPGIAKKTLLSIEEQHLVWWYDDGNVPEDVKIFTKAFCPGIAIVWLAVYWKGKLMGAW